MNRPRSNALTGSSDPRYRSPADIELYNAAKTPIAVAPELKSFLQKVFARKDLMETIQEPDTLSKGIYNLYAEGGGGSRLDQKSVLSQARDNWNKMLELLPRELLKNAFFQYTEHAGDLLQLDDKIIFNDDAVALEAAEDFLYFAVNRGRAACRVYLNLSFQSMPNLVNAAIKMGDSLNAEVIDLKTTGPGASRADSVVIYCASLEGAKKVAAAMAKAIQVGELKSNDQTVPAMTTRIAAGVSIGAEPKAQETGLAAHVKGYPPGAQSFGSIRSQVICAAILNYRENQGVLGKGYDVFQQLAAIGFKGYGLDPASPGS